MAVIDFLLLICSITLFGIPAIAKYYYGHSQNKIENFIYLFLPYLYTMTMAVQTASVYLTVGITVERYLAVCHPFRAREICTRGLGLSKTKISFRFEVYFLTKRDQNPINLQTFSTQLIVTLTQKNLVEINNS